MRHVAREVANGVRKYARAHRIDGIQLQGSYGEFPDAEIQHLCGSIDPMNIDLAARNCGCGRLNSRGIMAGKRMSAGGTLIGTVFAARTEADHQSDAKNNKMGN